MRARSSIIGIDASRALSAEPTGTETFSREIISSLLQQKSPFHFRLYTRATPPPNLFPLTGNYEIRAMPFPHVWTHARLSAEMLLHSPAALFVPAHVLPLIHPPHSFVTVHDLGYLYFPQVHRPLDRYYLDLSTRWNARKARVIFADSKVTASDLQKFYRVPAAKISVVYPGYDARYDQSISDAALAAVKARYGLGEYVLAVGTIHPRKNYARLIRVFAALPEKYQLVIVGKKGWLYEEIFATVEALNLAPRVKFLDFVRAEDLPALYHGARALVFTSLYEGFGLPILEAQVSGTPVVCSNTSSLPEVAGDGAEYFDPFDADAMAHALTRVLTDNARREELIERGRANLARFSWQRAAQQILEIITS